ncbi:MAG: aldehyde dehydrogenase (NADP(+)) [Microbacteriaceae bacterium]|nr:MAG: aldehyde dehydrogenase (NADP(+)) [Microbacteriaceae bacterium]
MSSERPTVLTTTNPRTGRVSPLDLEPTSPEFVAAATKRSEQASAALAQRTRQWRAGMLRALAASLESRRELLVSTADEETALGTARLDSELSRSVFQLRLFAEAIEEGGYLEAAIDTAAETELGPAPDVRRMLVPLGPVAVFGSSNFPFAFSVPGGDTASALAAGCPVVLKAHSSHLHTSVLSYSTLRDAARAYGAPEGSLELVLGQDAGSKLVADPRICAVSFTGSLSGGRALQSIIDARPRPVPFYGELSSVNPLIVTLGAASRRGAETASGLFASFTGSGGQFCTKPGIVFVPCGADGDRLVADLRALVDSAPSFVLLNRRIHDSFKSISSGLVNQPGVHLEATGKAETHADPDGFAVPAMIISINAHELTAEITEETFGPFIVVARYHALDEITRAFEVIPDSLTATIHSEPSEIDAIASLLPVLARHVGRIVFDGYPTGVRVSWAQHHGGPWPSTNSQHSSVGVTAIRRFMRPIAWQSAPTELLPLELRDGYAAIPRRIDGRLAPAHGLT